VVTQFFLTKILVAEAAGQQYVAADGFHGLPFTPFTTIFQESASATFRVPWQPPLNSSVGQLRGEECCGEERFLPLRQSEKGL
jgi:hypothetical protein